MTASVGADRFSVVYRLTGAREQARTRAEEICLEATVEVPADVPPRFLGPALGQWMVGHIESFEPATANAFDARISFPIETTAFELTQLLNVAFGNVSIKPGVRVQALDLPESLLRHFNGPRFGREALRAWVNATRRPMLCGTLKPMGQTAAQLAELAYLMAVGGLDMVKDDHGLSNQPYAPFEERVARCAEAIMKANRETGGACAYFPNITAPADKLVSRAQFARQAGARGLLISPLLSGFDAMRQLADEDSLSLPILSHPAFAGSYVTSGEGGLAHGVLFGQLMRLAGSDAAVFPNYGGRFAFSREECGEIRDATAAPMSDLKPIFPAPGGGMTLARLADMNAMYGADVIYLIGGGLLNYSPDVAENCRRLVELTTHD